MKQLFLLALLLSIQLYGQIKEGTYYTDEIIYCDIWEGVIQHESYIPDEHAYLHIDENGLRIYNDELIGRYYPWTYIGMYQDYQTYIMSKRNRGVWSENLEGIMIFYDLDEETHWYRKSIEYRFIKELEEEYEEVHK